MSKLRPTDPAGKVKSGDIVVLRWRDILGHDGAWATKDEVKGMKPLEMTTVGRLVSRTRRHVTIAGTWAKNDPDTWGNVNCIPAEAVIELERIPGMEARCGRKRRPSGK